MGQRASLLGALLMSALILADAGVASARTRIDPLRRAPRPRTRARASHASAAPAPGTSCSGERVVVFGATGYIGRAVVQDAARRGYPTTAVVRDASAYARIAPPTDGVRVVEADVRNRASLERGPLAPGAADVVICCLASRQGTVRDAEAIDYQATINCVRAAAAGGCRHFVLLSAICVRSAERREPNALRFQYCKLRVEEELRELAAAGRLSHAILRPTAFFKSVCNQFERVAAGGSFTFFDLGFGRCIRANPISERDLAAALVDAIVDRTRENTVWQIGGPAPPLSKLEQGALMAAAAGLPPPKAVAVPIAVLNGIVALLELLARLTRHEPLEDAAEVSRILRYYASEDMVAVAEGEVYGADTVADFYKTVAVRGREYDPYVASVFDSRKAVEGFGAKAADPVGAVRSADTD